MGVKIDIKKILELADKMRITEMPYTEIEKEVGKLNKKEMGVLQEIGFLKYKAQQKQLFCSACDTYVDIEIRLVEQEINGVITPQIEVYCKECGELVYWVDAEITNETIVEKMED